MRRGLFFFLLLLGFSSLFGANEANISTIGTDEYKETLATLNSRIIELNDRLTSKNVWVERYQVKEEPYHVAYEKIYCPQNFGD